MDTESVDHKRLRAYPTLWASVGVLQTFLTAGLVFGWASLLPILKEEGISLTAKEFASVFTFGAVGNYIAPLPFGILLDRRGPKTCCLVASALYAIGLLLCSNSTDKVCLMSGFGILGFAGPGIQVPTLHLAKLFPGDSKEGGTGGAAIFMSSQAASFDGGTAIFAIFRLLSRSFGLKSSTFFIYYLFVPLFTFITGLCVWPNDILHDKGGNEIFTGVGSPFISRRPHERKAINILKDAPLAVIFSHLPFYCLAAWVSIHILKLNFVVATINDQLNGNFTSAESEKLIGVFGAMLPFGFVVLPVVAFLLNKNPLIAFQLANVVGVMYGVVLAIFPGNAYLLMFVLFVSVATSRQLVYSTVFHQIGELFGFTNYGVLLGLTNVCVSTFSTVQTPLVSWSEESGSYYQANMVLVLATLPLFVIVTRASVNEHTTSRQDQANERTGLLEDVKPGEFPRSKSYVI